MGYLSFTFPRRQRQGSRRHAPPPSPLPESGGFPESGGRRITVAGVSKHFSVDGHPMTALSGIDLTIPAGSFTSIIGSSGCGKSTLLRIIAGLERSFEGEVRLEGQAITGPGRDRGMVFQEHRLLPWLTVEQNIAFALAGVPAADAREQVAQALQMVGLSAFAGAWPHQLSGGMAQRVAIARALVNQPDVLLLDEPFGALDAMTRISLQDEIRRIQEVRQTTMILVTHDVDEAVFLGDQVVVMSPRPGTVKTILPVPLERPRDRSSPGFVQLRKKLLDSFFTSHEPAFAYAI